MERFWLEAQTTQNIIDVSGFAEGTTPLTTAGVMVLEVEEDGGYGGVVEEDADGYGGAEYGFCIVDIVEILSFGDKFSLKRDQPVEEECAIVACSACYLLLCCWVLSVDEMDLSGCVRASEFSDALALASGS